MKRTGGLNSVLCHCVKVLLLLAAVQNAGLSQPGFWQSLNGPEGGVCQCFAVDNQGNILTGTYFGGVYKTTNRGGSWVRLSYGNWDIRSLLVHPSSGLIYLGAAASGVWKSSDGGITWIRPANINMGGRTVSSLALNAAGELIAACTSTSSQSVFWSPDSGENFYLVSSGVLSANSMVRHGNDLYVSGDRNGVIRSTNGGLLWSVINPSSAQFNGLSLTANANYVYVVGRRTATTIPDSSFIYRRSNATGNWELVHIQSGVILRTISSVGDTLLAAGDTTVLVSFNAGQSWIERSPPPQQNAALGGRRFRFVASYCARDIQFGGCAGSSVAFSDNFGLTWTQSSQGLQNTHVIASALLPNNRMLVSTQFDGLFLIDGVSTTRAGNGLPGDDVVTALASDDIIVLAGTGNHGLYRSTDGGSHFDPALYGVNASGILNITTRTSGTFRAAGEGEYVHTSTDFGVTWGSIRLPTNLTTNITGIEEVSANEYFVSTGPFGGVGSGDGVYRTTTGGSSWSQNGLQFVGVVSFDRTSDNKFLASSSVDAVYERDNTAPWTLTPTFNVGVKPRIVGFYEYSNQPLKELAGTSDGLYERRAFSADPWVKRVLGGDLEVSWFGIRNAGGLGSTSFPGQVVVGTYGGGVFQSSAPLTSSTENNIVPAEFKLEQNYPNPFNPSTTIGYRIQERGFVSLKVFDVLGREVATLVDEIKSAGEHAATFDGVSLSSGVYFYRLKAGEFVQTRKLVLLR